MFAASTSRRRAPSASAFGWMPSAASISLLMRGTFPSDVATVMSKLRARRSMPHERHGTSVLGTPAESRKVVESGKTLPPGGKTLPPVAARRSLPPGARCRTALAAARIATAWPSRARFRRRRAARRCAQIRHHGACKLVRIELREQLIGARGKARLPVEYGAQRRVHHHVKVLEPRVLA